MSPKYTYIRTQSLSSNSVSQSGFSLQEKATVHGEVETLETALFLKKASIPLCVGRTANASTVYLHRSVKINWNLVH